MHVENVGLAFLSDRTLVFQTEKVHRFTSPFHLGLHQGWNSQDSVFLFRENPHGTVQKEAQWWVISLTDCRVHILQVGILNVQYNCFNHVVSKDYA